MGSTGSFGFKIVSSLAVSLFLTGCSLSPTAPTSPSPTPIGAIRGNVHGGQQPVVGAHVYLFAANTTGNGGNGISPTAANASVSLLNPSTGHADALGNYVLTGADGGFSITANYLCDPGQAVYLYAAGGNPGAGTNSSASFMAVLGTCSAARTFAAAVPFVWINEVTTVAAAYAFAGFASDSTHVSSSNTNLAKTGISNAFDNAANITDIATGSALVTTPHGNGAIPQRRINALANSLAACVNASDSDHAQCDTLFVHARSSGSFGTEPSDTATAAINIAHNPTNAIDTILGLASGIGAPFLPTLSDDPDDPRYPSDFTLSVNYTGGVNKPSKIAIDDSGNVWVANSGGTSVSRLSSTGVPSTNSPYVTSGLQRSDGIAVDDSGSVWVIGSGLDDFKAIVKLSSNGQPSAGSPYTEVGTSGTRSIALDASNTLWIANSHGTVSRLSNSGAPVPGTPYNIPDQDSTGIAIDNDGNAWIANYTASSVTKLANDGTLISSPAAYKGGGINGPRAIAIDAFGNAWTANFGTNTITELSPAGTPVSSSPRTGGGMKQPWDIAIDGSSNIWIANFMSTPSIVSEFSNAGDALSGPAGFQAGGADGLQGIAVDGSGNVWTSNGQENMITQIIGAATPVVTPLAHGVANQTVATRP